MRLISSLLIAFLVMGLMGCKKEDCNPPENTSSALENGFLVLNEGLFQQNNASLTFVREDNQTIENRLFLNENGRLLGDTGNDMEIYQNNIYIVVNASSTIEVVNKETLKSVAQISMQYQGNSISPRAIDFYNNSAFVCGFDGYVYEINLSSNQITSRFQVGNNPEDVLVVNDKLFISNSGGLNAPNYDSTVFIYDILTSQITAKNVGANPGKLIADATGDVYVVKRGNYSSDPSSLVRLDVQNNYEPTALNIPCTSIFLDNDVLYLGFYDFSASTSNISTFDVNTESILNANFISSTDILTLYGVAVKNNVVYCMDARGFTNTGVIRKFNANGNNIGAYEVGLNPNKILFYE